METNSAWGSPELARYISSCVYKTVLPSLPFFTACCSCHNSTNTVYSLGRPSGVKAIRWPDMKRYRVGERRKENANVRGGAITYGVAITRGNPPNIAKMVNFTTLSYNGEEKRSERLTDNHRSGETPVFSYKSSIPGSLP